MKIILTTLIIIMAAVAVIITSMSNLAYAQTATIKNTTKSIAGFNASNIERALENQGKFD